MRQVRGEHVSAAGLLQQCPSLARLLLGAVGVAANVATPAAELLVCVIVRMSERAGILVSAVKNKKNKRKKKGWKQKRPGRIASGDGEAGAWLRSTVALVAAALLGRSEETWPHMNFTDRRQLRLRVGTYVLPRLVQVCRECVTALCCVM